MSDPEETTPETEPVTTEATETEAEATSTPTTDGGWDGPYDPDRAKRTIEHLRQRERELEPSHKALERLRAGEDRDTFRELAEKFGYEIPEDELEDEDESETDPYDQRIATLEQTIEAQQAAEAAKEFEKHLDKLASHKEIELTAFQRKTILRESLENGFNPESTEKAFNALFDEFSEVEKRAIERYTGSKKTPRVPGESKSATQVPDLDDDEQRRAWMKAQLAERNAQ